MVKKGDKIRFMDRNLSWGGNTGTVVKVVKKKDLGTDVDFLNRTFGYLVRLPLKREVFVHKEQIIRK